MKSHWPLSAGPIWSVLLVAVSITLVAGCAGGGSGALLSPPRSVHQAVHSEPGPQAVVDWNVIALNTSGAAAFNPPLETRNLAIVQAAVYDAVVTITGGYRPYLSAFKAARDASPEAAVATAAHDTLVALYPSQQTSLDTTYTNYLNHIGPGPATQAGVDIGHQTAAAIIAQRLMDGSGTIVPYTPGNQPGDWQPTPPLFKPALDPGWGAVTPFLLRRGDQFRPGEPPALTSSTYTQDYIEIKSVGAALSTTRTADQTTTAKFWISTAPQLWNQAVQQLVFSHHFNIAQAARAFALLNLAGADAIIGAWDAKFTYNQWRPITAIVNAGNDGNPNTIPDSSWTPLLITPPFPDYPAGHATFAGAAESVLTEIFGASPGSFQLTSATAPGVIHQYDSFEAVATEVVNARVWGGIHWRTSCTVGRAMGQLIGAFDIHHGLQPGN